VLQEQSVRDAKVVPKIDATLVLHEAGVLQMGISFVSENSAIAK
jgi:hypothetical protein